MYLKHRMLEARDYFIERVNDPLVKGIVKLAGRYPEPTRENCLHPNSIILLDIQDEFFQHWDLENRTPLVKAVFRILIVKYEHCPAYRNMLDWLLKELLEREWKPFNPNRQMRCWHE